MSSITTTQFIRKPLYVDAVRITGANFDAIAAWCQGEVLQDEVPGKGPGKKYIKVRVHNPKNARQTRAFVGDWLLYTERGYKVYTNKAFHASFDPVSVYVPSVSAAVESERAEAVSDGRAVTTEVAPGITQTVPATPEAIAQVVHENAIAQAETLEVYTDSDSSAETVDIGGTITMIDESEALTVGIDEQPNNVDTVPANEPIEPSAAEGKRVLSIAEQEALTPDEVRELVQSGEAVLAQDIAAA